MKLFLLSLSFFFSIHVFSQDDYPSTVDKSKLPVSVTNFNTFGYTDGKRLDSVDIY